jgi:DNA-binding transcriptional regulator YiaG
MKSKTSRKPLAESKRISSWDDAVFDPADLVRDMKDLADHYEGKKKLTLRTFTVVSPAPKFSPVEIVELREARKLSRPLFARILNVPVVTVRKWESGERMPSGAALRLLEVMRTRPDALLQLTAMSNTANRIKTDKTPQIELEGDELVSAVEDTVKGRTSELRSRERDAGSVRQLRRKAKS